jgi:hypothetical protein
VDKVMGDSNSDALKARITGAILIASGRVPTMTATRNCFIYSDTVGLKNGWV